MKKTIVPLVKISGDSSIYFDFEKHVPYIQHFGGRFTEAGGAKSYSYINTFGLSYLLMLLVGISGTILNIFIIIPPLFGIIFALLLGIALGKIFIKIIVFNSMNEREYRPLTNREIKKVIENGKSARVLRVVIILMGLGLCLATIIYLSEERFYAKDFIMFVMASFIISSINAIGQPGKVLKAIKILKKQLKEGKFDD